MTRFRFGALGILGAVVTLLTGVLAPASAAAHSPYCGLVWGSLPESRTSTTAGLEVTDVRAGRHACFDRVVVDLRGPAAPVGYAVRYVDAVHQPGSGWHVPLEGGAALEVVVVAPAYDEHWQPTYLPGDLDEAVDVDGFQTVRQIAFAGSFEGQTSLGIGTRARLPFRTFLLLGAPGDDAVRLVVDVAHRW